ncbi:hypothetical protein T11_5165 [Trichinella zimbabwensis]|uniref:Uncharacterized protein n=1 Tax=Trichinella zimbabwensis TaxID=268475 RepID=A0A0V1GCU7_9BILA|nr:hypothetical protein T11_5165 [Trichinella zimbabwensis]
MESRIVEENALGFDFLILNVFDDGYDYDYDYACYFDCHCDYYSTITTNGLRAYRRRHEYYFKSKLF